MKHLTREELLEVLINTALEQLKDVAEKNLGEQLVSWVEERQRIKFEKILKEYLEPDYPSNESIIIQRFIENFLKELQEKNGQ